MPYNPALRIVRQPSETITPSPFKVPAILTAIDCYCALATRLRFKYTYDLDPHALLLQVLVVAEVCE